MGSPHFLRVSPVGAANLATRHAPVTERLCIVVGACHMRRLRRRRVAKLATPTGAVGIQYRDYLPACLLGFLAACILFPIMGMNISNPNSPQFMMAAGIELAAMVTSCVVFHFYWKKHHQTV